MILLPEPIVHSKNDLHSKLLDWYQHNHRDFPWRETSDAFSVLLAEKLLQQTKARKLVVEIYTSLIKAFPTPQKLSEADIELLYNIVKPLGLAYRAQELKTMACEIAQKHNSRVPSDLKTLKQLTGVGEYCARAVICFAYDQRISIVDTNIARWLHRLCGIDLALPANPARKKYLYGLMDALLPEKPVRDFNLAVLDLCALICSPQKPKCLDCPIQEYCEYGQRILE